jgi:hypothetical protein
MKHLILILVFALPSLFSYTQDTINFINGESIIVTEYNISNEAKELFYKNEKGKTKAVEVESIFSINDKAGKKTIYYTPDSIMEDGSFTFSVAEMEKYMNGGKFARKNYKAKEILLAGFAIGATSGLLIPSFYSPIAPAVFTGVAGNTYCQKHINKKYPEYANDSYFMAGFKEYAKSKRTKNAIVGGIAGLIVGVGTSFIISSLQ